MRLRRRRKRRTRRRDSGTTVCGKRKHSHQKRENEAPPKNLLTISWCTFLDTMLVDANLPRSASKRAIMSPNASS